MKILDDIWFSNFQFDIIGIVIGEDEVTGERKAYIGVGQGKSIDDDIQSISMYGAKVTPEMNNDEIKLLMEALNALETKAVREALSSGLLNVMLADNKEKAKEQLKKTMGAEQKKADDLTERIILLKAKLIQMKDRNIANEAGDFLKNSKEL